MLRAWAFFAGHGRVTISTFCGESISPRTHAHSPPFCVITIHVKTLLRVQNRWSRNALETWIKTFEPRQSKPPNHRNSKRHKAQDIIIDLLFHAIFYWNLEHRLRWEFCFPLSDSHKGNIVTNAVSIVIPAYNEESGIPLVLAELRRVLQEYPLTFEIIVVDDGSSDATARAAAQAGARVMRHKSNRGYGAALKTGIAAARNDQVIIIDADGTYPAKYVPILLEQLERADMVVGSRVNAGAKIPLVRRPAKWVLNRLANYLTNAKIPDLNSGLRAFRRGIVMQYFPILPDQFSWTTTITLAMQCDKYAVVYVPIDYLARKGRSKIVPWDAGSFLILILRTSMLFKPLRIFLPIVVVFATYGIVKLAIDLTHQPNVSASAALALICALLVLLIGMLGDVISTRMGRFSANAIPGVANDDTEVEVERRGQ
jgi:glycosyltransferase involved in cell wall biosynthesis